MFAENYKIEGVLSLPYADLIEPFTVYYDQQSAKSRSSFYNDLYQVYQFGPNKTSVDNKHGTLFKFAWVPSALLPSNDRPSSNRKPRTKTLTRRACFKVAGTDVYSIGPQSVLPDMAEFTFDSFSKCPASNVMFSRDTCELWKRTTSFGDKKNTYKFWVKRVDNQAIPVQYYMQGYDTLLGSHYDRYDFKYVKYEPNASKELDFSFDSKVRCESMPGPGNSESERAHMIVQNPFHELITEPHRYDHIEYQFSEFKKVHNKNYNDNEVAERKAQVNLLHNSRLINSHNRKSKHYKLKVNKFADENVREARYLRGRFHSKGYNGGLEYKMSNIKIYESSARGLGSKLHSSGVVPETWDWRLRGAVTPVKDQAVCGSCWSFGTSGSIEGALFVKTGKLIRLSQQQMVDCSWKYGNNGCDGGEDFRAYKYIMDAGGLASEEDYGHYIGVDGKCHDWDVKKSVRIAGFYNVTSNNVAALKDALIKYGPVTVGIDASPSTFTFYSSGVYFDESCRNKPEDLDHQVLVVGFGKIDNQEYWLVKNSWSTLWGNDGYILLSTKDNNCGVMTAPTVPIVEAVKA